MLGFIRKIKLYLKEKQDKKKYKELIRKESNTWNFIKSHKTPCYIKLIDKDGNILRELEYKGDIVVVREENNLGKRRFRVVNSPSGFFVEQTEYYSDLLLWVEQGQEKLPPMKELVYNSFIDIFIK